MKTKTNTKTEKRKMILTYSLWPMVSRKAQSVSKASSVPQRRSSSAQRKMILGDNIFRQSKCPTNGRSEMQAAKNASYGNAHFRASHAQTLGCSDVRTLGRRPDARASGCTGVRTPTPLIFNFYGRRDGAPEPAAAPNHQPLTQPQRRGPRRGGRKNC